MPTLLGTKCAGPRPPSECPLTLGLVTLLLQYSTVGRYAFLFEGVLEQTGLLTSYFKPNSIGYYAQLGAQPLGAYLLVKLPIRGFLSAVVLCWGASLCGMAGSTSYHTLLATRFLLGGSLLRRFSLHFLHRLLTRLPQLAGFFEAAWSAMTFALS